MKKSLKLLIASLLLISIFVLITLFPPAVEENVFRSPLFSDTVQTYEISGRVLFKESSQPVLSGYVKAVKFDWENDKMITVDSSVIKSEGFYNLRKCTHDSLYIMAYSDDEFEDFIPGYHDTTIHWLSSVVLKPAVNINYANINVNRIVKQENGTHHVSGKILKDPSRPNEVVENALIFAKIGTKFKGYGVSDAYGNYHIDSLPSGDLEIIAERMGYYRDYRYIQIGQFNADTVNFYLLRVAGVSNPENRIPKQFMLYNNYPNPFNPVTKIKFSLPLPSKGGAMDVKLVVYDILGREVANLIPPLRGDEEGLQPGTYEVEWDGTNYCSGIYFYRLETDEYIETKKMILMK